MAQRTVSSGDREPTAAERAAWRHESAFAIESEANPADFPRMHNMSAGFFRPKIMRPLEPTTPDYATIEIPHDSLELAGQVAEWNLLWEAGQFRRRFFGESDLPKSMYEFADMGDINVTFLPRTHSRYFEYAPLYHMLPKATLLKFGLPLLRAGQWPYMADFCDIDSLLPTDFHDRLARAWAHTVWPKLNSGSPMRAFAPDEPIRLLGHNLDFWVPAASSVIESTLRSFPKVDNGVEEAPVKLEDGSILAGAVVGSPRKGGDIWAGEEQARWAVEDTVEAADTTGRLRDILDAVKSNRVEDDFSNRWSYAREDFERKLYHKRNKARVTFVELDDTIPVQSPEADIHGNAVTSNFLALLDEKQRAVVVLLNSGYRQYEIAEQLGYANHSPISKQLAQIRRLAASHFGIDESK